MDIVIDSSDDQTILRPMGRIDSNTAGILKEALLEVVEENRGTVILDFSAMPYISSAGLRVILLAIKALEPQNQRLKITQAGPAVMTVFTMTNFSFFVDIEPKSPND